MKQNSEKVMKIEIEPCHPGDFIRGEILEELNLSIRKAAQILGVRTATLSDLVNEKSSLSPEMALRIEKAFGIGMDLLLKIQAWYDVCRMRKKSDSVVVERYEPSAA